MPVRSTSVFLALLLVAPTLQSAESCRPQDADRPSIGLVLGGGGARGSAHIGVIRALEEMRVPIDCVVGTSMGSLVGALYATGMSVPEMEETIAGIDWEVLFRDETPRVDQPYRRKRDDEIFALYGPKIGIGPDTSLIPTGLISGQNINFLFESLISERVQVEHFDELTLPFRAVAADLLTGEAVVMDRGNLALAMRASMSVPAVFDPVSRDGRLLVDGGIANNLPVDVARDMGADIVIAVDVGSGGLEKDEVKNLLSVVSQLTNLMVMGNVEASRASLTEDDLLIKPELGRGFSAGAFARSSEGAEIGYTSTQAIRADISRLSLTESDYEAYAATLTRRHPTPPIIDFVRLENESQFADELILQQLNLKIGAPIDRAQLESDIRMVYGLGFLDMVRYEVVEDNGERGLNLYVRQDTRGTNYLEWGLDLFADDLTNGFNLRLGYLKTDLDDLGSELRVMGQFGRDNQLVFDLYKYLDRSAKFFILPRAFAETREFSEFIDGEASSVNELEQYGIDVALGREFSRHAALSAGLRVYTGSVDTLIGEPDPDDGAYDAGEYFLDWTYDRLDNRYLPHDGIFYRLGYYGSADWLGSNDDYDQLQLTGVWSKALGRHILTGGVSVDATIDGVAPKYALFGAGGLFNLSGYNLGEVSGQNLGVLTFIYQYEILGGFVPGRIGGSLEYGGVTDDWEDLFQSGEVHGSLHAAFNTPIGPAYLGWGWGENGQSRWFMKFGRIFGSPSVIR
jgi:NTE family protein